ncbi:hypothetical protein EJP02_521 [Escherichia phage EJP2]|nr:hypothetical protein EJP02_521 [Escherichia phage EJP2]
MLNILIVDEHGKELESFESMINPIGSKTITTNLAVYECNEFSVDFKRNEIVVHVQNDFMKF